MPDHNNLASLLVNTLTYCLQRKVWPDPREVCFPKEVNPKNKDNLQGRVLLQEKEKTRNRGQF